VYQVAAAVIGTHSQDHPRASSSRMPTISNTIHRARCPRTRSAEHMINTVHDHPLNSTPIKLSEVVVVVVLTNSKHLVQRAIVIPAGSQHERLAVPIRKQRHTCMSAWPTTGHSAGLAACCLQHLHAPVDSTNSSYHCHTVAQFHLETEHSSKPSPSRVSQRQ